MGAAPGLDLGVFSKRTILTGAGWTRNWGGRLASEVWQDLMSNPAIQDHASIRELMLEEGSFESVLGRLQGSPSNAAEREVFERAVMDVFIAMDAEVARPRRQPWINIYKVQDLLFRFWGERGDGVNAGYIFTLNQDLWLERNLYNGHVAGAAAPALPGVKRRANQRLFEPDLGRYGDAFIVQPASGPVLELQGAFNVIKLHGSFNWRTPDGRNAMIVGTKKTAQIASFPLLEAYWQTFKAVLQAGDVRLMIVGYGFSDDHVNAVIADSVENHGLRVFVWDTDPNLKDLIRGASRGSSIWKGVLSTASRPMIEVFPSDQSETGEYRRIVETIFRR